jgi:hypothetical protein
MMKNLDLRKSSDLPALHSCHYFRHREKRRLSLMAPIMAPPPLNIGQGVIVEPVILFDKELP